MLLLLPYSLNPTSPVVEQIKSIIILPINRERNCGCGAVKRRGERVVNKATLKPLPPSKVRFFKLTLP